MTDTATDHWKTRPMIWDQGVGVFVSADNHPNIPMKKFLKGPVPWSWIEAASKLPGKTLAVGLCLWRLAGAMKCRTVKLSNTECEALGVDRHAKSRALKTLKIAGLVSIYQKPGCLPKVTILDVIR